MSRLRDIESKTSASDQSDFKIKNKNALSKNFTPLVKFVKIGHMQYDK